MSFIGIPRPSQEGGHLGIFICIHRKVVDPVLQRIPILDIIQISGLLKFHNINISHDEPSKVHRDQQSLVSRLSLGRVVLEANIQPENVPEYMGQITGFQCNFLGSKFFFLRFFNPEPSNRP